MSEKPEQPSRLAELIARARDDGRFKPEAYLFVIEALSHKLKQMDLMAPEKRRHLTAVELLDGIRSLGWERYGRLVKQVFEDWGVASPAHFGEIVFNLIDWGEFTKTDEDRREDFSVGSDFHEGLVEAYRFGQTGDKSGK